VSRPAASLDIAEGIRDDLVTCRQAGASRKFAARQQTRSVTVRYKGSCHCGTIAFEVEGEITKGLACNCSICQRKGSLLWFVPRNSLALSTPEEDSRVYLFNKHLLKHRFCPTCGIHPYAEGKDPKGNEMAAVNIRCLEGIDLSAIPVTHFDGRSV
jgi:hypothetical protein